MGLFGTAGSIGGGVAGGALGSSFGPVGTVAGGYLGSRVGGMIGGMLDDQGNPVGEQAVPTFTPFSYENTGTDYRGERQAADARRAPRLDWAQEQADYARQIEARGRQEDLARSLVEAREGKAPSVAALQAQQGLQNAQMQGLQLAANARGGAGAQILAQQGAQRQAALSAQSATREAAIMRAQEIAQARQEEGALYNAMRSGDLGARQQSMGKQGLISQNELATRQMNDARSMGLLHSSIQEQQAALQAGYQNAALQMQGQTAVINANSAAQQAAAARNAGIFGSVLGAGGSVLGAGVSSGWFKGGGGGGGGGAPGAAGGAGAGAAGGAAGGDAAAYGAGSYTGQSYGGGGWEGTY